MNLKFETIVQIFRKLMQINAVIILKSTNEYYRKIISKSGPKMDLYPAMANVVVHCLSWGHLLFLLYASHYSDSTGILSLCCGYISKAVTRSCSTKIQTSVHFSLNGSARSRYAYHGRIKVHFAVTFWDNFLIVFISAFQNDDYSQLYYLPQILDNGFKL